MGDFREPNGVVLEESPISSSPSSISSPIICVEKWARAEQTTQEIIRQVQPTVVSEERRRDVIDYVQRLLKGTLGCEVFPFGSVPLKTYLPDGDIDLTAFCGFNLEESFATDVYSVLEREDHNRVAEFVVKDVQYIRAEVKLVKCLVQNIVVDISFNQIGGLCALCFLEEVDRLIGKDHLFKRSIILIKAWCYYESRILGAHHGLISTYALETLVLYIFHLFHSSLTGPLAVLYKFLDYFSKFDWESYCVSLSGPVPVSSLPDIVAGRPENGGGELLLSHDFMRECVNKFSVPSRGTETNSRSFLKKHLNIVDPLKANNNLGRSVSKGNFFRIRSAFTYGARKLGQILSQPQNNVAEEVRRFFTNTLDRHGQGQRPDVQDILLASGCNGFVPEMLFTCAEHSPDESCAHEVESVNSNERSSECRVASEDTGHGVVSNVWEPVTYFGEAGVEQQRGFSSTISSDAEPLKDVISLSASRLSGDAIELAACGIENLRITIDADKSSPSVDDESKLPSDYTSHAPYPSFSHHLDNGKMENGDLDENVPTYSHSMDFPSMAGDGQCLQDSNSMYCSNRSSMTVGSHETPNMLPDLSGNVVCHLESLRYGQWWYDCDQFLAASFQPIHLAPPLFQRKNRWDATGQSMHFRRDMVPRINVNGVVPRPAFFPPVVAGAGFVDDMPKPRGTGTYFPITNHHSYRDRPSTGRGRNQGQLKSPRTNGRAPTTPQDRSTQAQSPVRPGPGKPRSSDSYGTSPRGKVFKEVNGFVPSSEKADKFGAQGPLTPTSETPLPERESNRPPDPSTSPGNHNGGSVFVNNDRLGVQSYRLINEEDFPPLSA